MDAHDPQPMYDLRKKTDNSNIRNEELEYFWKELEAFLKEKYVVHERRI